MPVNASRAGFDTFTAEQFPNTNHGDWRVLNLSGGTGTRRYGYVFFGGIPPTGATVISASLRVWLHGAAWSGGPHTITARRITATWKESLLTWARSGSTQMGSTVNPASAQVTGGVESQLVELDVSLMLADIAAGQPWYGIRLEVGTTDGVIRRVHSSEASNPDLRPQLLVTWNRAPLAPVDMAPSGARSVSVAKPVLTWVFKDREGDAQAEYQVQVSTGSTVDGTGAFTTPEFQSGPVASPDGQHDLNQPVTRTATVTTTLLSTTITAATATFDSGDVGASITGTGIPAGTTITAVASATSATISQAANASGTITATITRTFPALADGAVRYWIVRAKDVHGLMSPWSAVAQFRRDTKGTLTINSPLNGGTVEETTPPVTTTLTGRAQEAISYRLEEDDGTGRFVTVWEKLRHTAAADAGAAYTFTIPAGKIARTGRNYRITVRSWDTVDREATPGDPTDVPAQATFTFIRSATPAPITSLTVVEEQPGVKLTFNRAAGQANPDYFALVVNGVRVLDRINPVTFSQGGDPIVYTFVYYGAAPRVAHTFEVEAVVLDAGTLKHSQGNATQNVTPKPGGLWLVDDDQPPYLPTSLPRRVRILGSDAPDLSIGESSTQFFPLGRRDPVRIVDSIRGLEGTIAGTLRVDDPAGSDFVDNFRWMKHPDRVGRRFRLLATGLSLPVQLGDASFAPTRRNADEEYSVSVQVAQVAEFK